MSLGAPGRVWFLDFCFARFWHILQTSISTTMSRKSSQAGASKQPNIANETIQNPHPERADNQDLQKLFLLEEVKPVKISKTNYFQLLHEDWRIFKESQSGYQNGISGHSSSQMQTKYSKNEKLKKTKMIKSDKWKNKTKSNKQQIDKNNWKTKFKQLQKKTKTIK